MRNGNNNEHDDLTLDPNAQVTAYALGELDDAESKEVERRIEGDTQLRQAIEDIRRTARALEDGLHHEPTLSLTDQQKDEVLEPRPLPMQPARRRSRIRPFHAVAAVLICTLSVAIVVMLVTPRMFKSVEVAKAQSSLTESRDAERTEVIERTINELKGRVNPTEVVDVSRSVAIGGELTSRPTVVRAGQDAEIPRNEDESTAYTLVDPYPVTVTPKRLDLGRIPTGEGSVVLHNRGVEPMIPRQEGYFAYRRSAGSDVDFGAERYGTIIDNLFHDPSEKGRALSTFSIDVDTASYANVRRFLRSGQRPPADAVRIEEMLNYFTYDYEPPGGEHPFSVSVDAGPAPWSPQHRLVRIGLQGVEIDVDTRPATNLVFLLDVSGSMNQPNKLPLVKQSLRMLVERLTPDDRVAIVVYAGASGLVLPSTYCYDRAAVYEAIERLHAGGSTNGGAGIELAYNVAADHFIEGGVNRVILATDGDFNVGVSGDADLVRLIEEKRRTGVFLSILGFGTGNFQDAKMEKLSNSGNGTFAYIDSLREAEKVLVDQMAGTLVTIAKDVKIQVEFNPARVGAYRLIGYANRLLAAKDFNDDTKDAGEIGAGHTVTALYEIVPPGVVPSGPGVDPLKYQQTREDVDPDASKDMLTVKLRYKRPDGDTSTKMEVPFVDAGATLEETSADFRFAAAVAQFGMLLRESPYCGEASFASVLDLAVAGSAESDDTRRVGYRKEFLELVALANILSR